MVLIPTMSCNVQQRHLSSQIRGLICQRLLTLLSLGVASSLRISLQMIREGLPMQFREGERARPCKISLCQVQDTQQQYSSLWPFLLSSLDVSMPPARLSKKLPSIVASGIDTSKE